MCNLHQGADRIAKGDLMLHDLMILTNTIKQSPSSEANSRSLRNEIPRPSWNPKFRVRNSPPLVPILSQMHPVYSLTNYFSKIHSHIIPFYTQDIQMGTSLSVFRLQLCMRLSSFPCMLHAPSI